MKTTADAKSITRVPFANRGPSLIGGTNNARGNKSRAGILLLDRIEYERPRSGKEVLHGSLWLGGRGHAGGTGYGLHDAAASWSRGRRDVRIAAGAKGSRRTAALDDLHFSRERRRRRE